MTILYILIALAAGIAVGLFLKKKETDRLSIALNGEKAARTHEAQMAEERLKNCEEAHRKDLENERLLHAKDLENKERELADRREMQRRQEAMWNEQMGLMKAQFKELADEVLKDKSAAMKQANDEQLQAILTPFREKIGELADTVQQSKKENAVNRASIEKTIALMMQRATEIGQEADKLTAALRHNGKVQGDWGEVILERILEDSGLRKGEEYFPQANYTADDGRNERPDMVVQLPGRRKVIIDSKTSLTAYVNYTAATDEAARAAALRDHVISVKKHIDELAAKNYPRLLKGQAVDYVLMFIPNEGSYITAMQADATLALYAYRKNIILINPTNLMLALKLVYSLWQAERQNKNVATIIDRAEKLYARFVEFSATFDRLNDGLTRLRTLYDKGRSQLVTGRGNITRQLTELKRCGVTPAKEFPAQTLEDAENGDTLPPAPDAQPAGTLPQPAINTPQDTQAAPQDSLNIPNGIPAGADNLPNHTEQENSKDI